MALGLPKNFIRNYHADARQGYRVLARASRYLEGQRSDSWMTGKPETSAQKLLRKTGVAVLRAGRKIQILPEGGR